jgi:hypothetical protein
MFAFSLSYLVKTKIIFSPIRSYGFYYTATSVYLFSDVLPPFYTL